MLVVAELLGSLLGLANDELLETTYGFQDLLDGLVDFVADVARSLLQLVGQLNCLLFGLVDLLLQDGRGFLDQYVDLLLGCLELSLDALDEGAARLFGAGHVRLRLGDLYTA